MRYKCMACGKCYPVDTTEYICGCGGLFGLDFTPEPFSPEHVDMSAWSIFAYRRFFPLQNELWRQISLGEGMTPIIRLDDRTLLKMEYMMPTLSFKDRGAALIIWLCKTLGVERVIQDSSGNAGNSIAAYCAKAGIECDIFVPKATSSKKIEMIRAHGAAVTVVNGTRDETALACRERADRENLFYASHVYNPLFYEGTKTYIYEVFHQLSRLPDNIFVPVGNGTMFLGVVKGVRELLRAGLIKHIPKLFAVQSERCAPLYKAYLEHSQEYIPVEPEETLAEGIAIGYPMRHKEILEAAREMDVVFIAAKEDDIPVAKKLLAVNGVYVENTAAATMAAYLEYTSQRPLNGESLIPMCGAGLKSGASDFAV